MQPYMYMESNIKVRDKYQKSIIRTLKIIHSLSCPSLKSKIYVNDRAENHEDVNNDSIYVNIITLDFYLSNLGNKYVRSNQTERKRKSLVRRRITFCNPLHHTIVII